MKPVGRIGFSEGCWVLPGIATAHSHAFQRALRGRTHRKASSAGSFWSWRGLMYDLVNRLTPEDVYAVTRFAYTELAMSGITAVGEFHYVHHDIDGLPYGDRLELTHAVIRAAQDVGLRVCLIRTGYMRGGNGVPLESAQRRFADSSSDDVLEDMDALRSAYGGAPGVSFALAAHSVRAVPRPDIVKLSRYASENALPFHMHVSEQRRELQECVAEYGKTPVAMLFDEDILSEQFVAVHATHLAEDECQMLGESRATVCLCRSTERDLGDGLPDTARLASSGTRICMGVDSHAEGNAFEDIRAVELDERSRAKRRQAVFEGSDLLTAASEVGYAACNLVGRYQEDEVHLNADDPSIAGLDQPNAVDGILFGASARAVEKVVVGGKTIVDSGIHRDYESAHSGYLAALKRLELL